MIYSKFLLLQREVGLKEAHDRLHEYKEVIEEYAAKVVANCQRGKKRFLLVSNQVHISGCNRCMSLMNQYKLVLLRAIEET